MIQFVAMQAVVYSNVLLAHVSSAHETAPGVYFSFMQVRAEWKSKGNISTAGVTTGDCHRKGDSGTVNMLDGDQGRNVMLIPAAKFAFCSIPKVASSDFDNMILFANGLPLDTCEDNCGQHSRGANAESFGLDTSVITKANGWTYAFFIRDPLERYLSAFGSKCIPDTGGNVEGEGQNCCGEFLTKPADTSKYLDLFEEHVWIDHQRGLPLANEHWVPQIQFLRDACDLFDPSEADYIGQMSGDVHMQVKDMLKTAGVENFDDLANQFFPSSGNSIDKKHTSTVSSDYAIYYKKPEIAQMVADLYTEDYNDLPLDPPILYPANL